MTALHEFLLFYSSFPQKSTGSISFRQREKNKRGKKAKKQKRTLVNVKNGLYIRAKFGMM